MSYIEVPAQEIRDLLTDAGFRLHRGAEHLAFEEIWDRPHDKDGRYLVRVYSSIQLRTDQIRGKGEDAIKVLGLFVPVPGTVQVIYKGRRIHRTGTVEGVLGRLLERAREAYAALNKVIAMRLVPVEGMATPRQLKYLQDLRRDLDLPDLPEGMTLTKAEASAAIQELKEQIRAIDELEQSVDLVNGYPK